MGLRKISASTLQFDNAIRLPFTRKMRTRRARETPLALGAYSDHPCALIAQPRRHPATVGPSLRAIAPLLSWQFWHNLALLGASFLRPRSRDQHHAPHIQRHEASCRTCVRGLRASDGLTSKQAARQALR
jgi:hypothetical protein